MSELPDGIEPAPIPEPKDSALGIVVAPGPSGSLRVLLGRRARTSRFMPGHLAFIGGRMEARDEPSHPGAFERCVSREVLEESGLAIPPERWIEAGERTTPPFFPVRFRTKFFVAALRESDRLPDTPPQPEEIETLAFAEPAQVLADWESGRALVPPPLLPILRRLASDGPRDAAAVARAVLEINVAEDPHPRIEFVPGVWALPVRTRTLPPASCTNVWIPGGTLFAVVDPGSSEPGEIEKILHIARRRAADGAAPDAVLLTHHHRDHVGGAEQVAAALGVPIAAHAETLSRLPVVAGGAARRPLADGDVLDLGGLRLEVLHTPGHAPGHLALFDRSRRLLIAGDLVSGLSTILVGFADGDMDLYLDSLRRVAALNPATVLPSHGPPLPGQALAATIAHREEREAKVAAALGTEPKPLSEIAAIAYADTPAAPPFLRELQARAHLLRLARRGDAASRAADGSAWSR